VEVHGKGVLWAMDATHLGRTEEGGKVKVEVVREVATTKVLEAVVGKPASAREAVAILECAADAAGAWPIVLASDRGPEYVGREMAQCLQSHQVVHLRSAPRTPQQNSWAERAIGELKEQAAVERAPQGADVFEEWRVRVHKAKARLKEHRLRSSRGFRTAEQLDKITEPGRLEWLRARF
jgi:transposase InsO family protein